MTQEDSRIMSNLATTSVAQIQAKTEALSPPNASTKVVRVGNFAVDFGARVSPIEGQTQRIISENTGVLVPKVSDIFSTSYESDLHFYEIRIWADS